MYDMIGIILYRMVFGEEMWLFVELVIGYVNDEYYSFLFFEYVWILENLLSELY